MDTLSLPKLFHERAFRIPDYQRGYAWETEQVDDFLEDLALLGPSSHHYTGTVVLHKLPDAKKRMDDSGETHVEHEVVDGQQRLTTTVILLHEISRALSDYEASRSLAEGIRRRYIHTKDTGGGPLYKLSLNDDTDSFFKGSILSNTLHVAPPPVASAQRLKNARQQIEEYLSKADGHVASREQWLHELHNKITTQLSFNLYEVDSKADVRLIFEAMNDRGKPLTELEKVKNYLFYAASSLELEPATLDDFIDSVNHAWADVLTRLMAAELGSPASEDQLLRAHWIMQYDPDSRKWHGSKSIRHRFDLRDYRNDHPRLLHELREYVENLREACVCYCDALNPARSEAFGALTGTIRNEIKHWNTNLVNIGVTAPFLPLLMAVRERWSSDPKKYLDILKLCEVLAFRTYRLARATSAYRQSAMFHLAFDVAHDQMDFDEAIGEAKQHYNDAWVREAFDNFTNTAALRSVYGWSGLKYFLYEYEEHLASDSHGSPKVTWDDIKDKRDTIEHVLPQSIEGVGYWQNLFDAVTHEEYVHDIGNLTLTKGNPELGNKKFAKKKMDDGYCYEKSLLLEERELLKWDDWTAKAIDNRRAQLLAWARERWHVDFGDVSGDMLAPDDEDDETLDEDGEE